MDNPFDRYDLDPRQGIEAITQRLKELAEDATSDEEREALRKTWEELTFHPAERLRAALLAYPETRAPLGKAPPRTRLPAEGSCPALTLRDLAARPSAVAALGVRPAEESTDEEPLLPLDDDAILSG